MDADEIRTLLGEAIFERVKKYRRAAAAAITTRRHGCGKTAALSARPAAARITRTARVPTASTSVRC